MGRGVLLWPSLFAGCLAAVTFAAQEPQVLRSRVEAVRVDVTVTNRQGVFEAGLTQDDFEILDNGRPQRMTGFSSGPSPLTVGFVLDMSDSMIQHTRRLGAAAEAFIGALQPADRASVGSLTVPGQRRTDASALRQDLSYLTLGEPSFIWRGLQLAASSLDMAEGRRAVLISTDGKDSGDHARELAPQIAAGPFGGTPLDPGSHPRWALAQDWFSRSQGAARALDQRIIQLYVVALPGARVTETLRDLAEDSGGRVIAVKRDANLAQLFDALVGELRQQYVLSYAPPEQDGEVHEIEVRLKRSGLVARTRRSYVAGEK